MHKRAIEEQILNLRCPRCSAVFADFANCFALTCGKCRAGFCAWCLADCGKDAHRHVANCAENRAPGRNVYGNVQLFKEAHAERRRRLVDEYVVSRVRDDLRELVRAAIGPI